MGQAWFAVQKKILDWEWFHSPFHLRMLLVLIARANYKPSKWRGLTLDAGQLITGRIQLSEWCEMSESSVRRVLKDLEDSETVTIKRTNKYSIITITNWDLYQNPEKSHQQMNQQMNQQKATSNKLNNKTNKQIRKNKPSSKALGNEASQPLISDDACMKYIQENYSILDTEVQTWLQAASLSSLKRIREFSSDQAILGTIPDAMEYASANKKKYKAIGSFLLNWIGRSGFSHEREDYERSLAFVAMMEKAEQKGADAEN